MPSKRQIVREGKTDTEYERIRVALYIETEGRKRERRLGQGNLGEKIERYDMKSEYLANSSLCILGKRNMWRGCRIRIYLWK